MLYPLTYPWETIKIDLKSIPPSQSENIPWQSQLLIGKETTITNATTGGDYPTKVLSDKHKVIELPGPAIQGDTLREINIEIDQSTKVNLLYSNGTDSHKNSNFEYFFDKIMNAMLFITRDSECLNVKNFKFQTVYWDQILKRLHAHKDKDPARYALVVDLADLPQLIKPIDRITTQPKRVLRRVYDQERIQKVREVDKKCVIDLARRPGSILAEKAGPKQRILAIKRNENINILENRVTKHCCSLAIRASERYIREHEKENITAKESKRIESVQKLTKECKRLPLKEQFNSVLNLNEPCRQPNYTLMQNADYHKVWKAYAELVRNEDLRAELWKWYRRMWSDYVGMFLASTLYSLDKILKDISVSEIGDKTVLGKRRQDSGSWFYSDILPGPFIINPDSDSPSTLYVVHGDCETLEQISPSLQPLALLNADYLFINICNDKKSVLPIYSIMLPHHLNKSGCFQYLKDIPSNLMDNLNYFNKHNKTWTCKNGWVLLGNWNKNNYIDKLQNLGEGMTCYISEVNPDYSAWKSEPANYYLPLKTFFGLK